MGGETAKRVEAHMRNIRKMSAPIASLSPDGVRTLVTVLASGATVALDALMPPDNVTLVKSDQGRVLVVVGSREAIDAFAVAHRLSAVLVN